MSRRKRTLLAGRRSRYGYIFAMPWIMGLIVFVIIPLVTAVRISLSTLSVGIERYTLDFVGLLNYKYIFLVGVEFRETLVSSFLSMAYNVPLTIFFSFFLASVLNMKFKGQGLVRSILFIPVVIASGAVDTLMKNDYLSVTAAASTKSSGSVLASGFIRMISDFDLPRWLVAFLEQSVTQIYVITVMSAVPIVIFIAALQSVPDSVFEAAYIEGASAWEVFFKIKFPLVSPHILVCIIYSIIDSLNNAANPVVSLIKRTTYGKIEYGYGAAMSFSYMAATLAVIFIIYKTVSRWVVYTD